MSAPVNYDDALGQLRDAGLLVESIELARIVRCKVEGEGSEKRGWYMLHEWTGRDGDVFLVGSFGVWRGAENNARQIEIRKYRQQLSDEDKAAIKARIAADKQREAARRRREAERARAQADRAWQKCDREGESEYLDRKQVKAFGVRFSRSGVLTVPIRDAAGRLHGLQFIYPKGHKKKPRDRDKTYWPTGLAKQGHFHLVGAPQWVVLLAEGYATAASLHEATGLPVAVAFDANNLLPVAQALRKRYRWTKILICADDDWLGKCRECQKMTPVSDPLCRHCGKEHGKKNTGVELAEAAAFAVDGAVLVPQFADRGDHKWTDFNDLQLAEDPPAVGYQVEERLRELGWREPAVVVPYPKQGDGDGELRPIESSDELFERFALVYAHNQTVFDFREHILMTLSDMRDACTHKDVHRRWMENPNRKIVRVENVGFDPAGSDPEITCNLFGGWPTEPRQGDCTYLKDLLLHLCGGEDNPREVFTWVMQWLAYPIRNPGAKMKTALVFHGPQGVGKNLFFESVMAIYGKYGRIVNQDAIEDKYNDWASKKLFMIADEVVARQELYHVKNKMKGFITNDTIRINPKHVTSYEERNHVNLVFLSNEIQPLVLERDDRRYTVIWTPPAFPEQIYQLVADEIRAGGIGALHHELKYEVKLDGFGPHSKPPMTKAKADLIDLSQDNIERFLSDWTKGEIDGIPVEPCISRDLFELYKAYCSRLGYPRHAPMPKMLAEIEKRSPCTKRQAKYLDGGTRKNCHFIFPPGAEPEVGESQESWLSGTQYRFREAVRNWKDNGL